MSESTFEVKPSNFTFVEKRGRPKAENPFGPYISESWAKRDGDDAKVGMSQEVTIEDLGPYGLGAHPAKVVTVIGQIRQAAAEQGLGVLIQTEYFIKKGQKLVRVDSDSGRPPTKATIYFAAKPRTKRKRKSEESE